MALVLLTYQEATTVDGAALLAGVWNKVLINTKVRDDNNNCVINANNTFTLTSKIYPKIVRINATSSLVNLAANPLVAKSRFLSIQGASTEVLDTSLNVKVIGGAEHQGTIKEFMSFTLSKLTTLQYDIWTTRISVFGRAVSDGSPEKYATLEITVE